MIDVSVIATAINEGEEPRSTVESARSMTKIEFEAVLCDQGGNETEGWDVLTYAEPGVHPGFEAARRAASGKVIVVIDSHMRFPERWLEKMLSEWHRDENRFICSASTGMKPKSKMLGFGGYWTFTEDGRFALRWNLKRDRPTQGVIGACYMIGAGDFDRIGGFMPALGLHGGLCEDLSWRALACGMGVAAVPDVVVAHLYRKQHSHPIPWHEAMFGRFAWPIISLEAHTVRHFFKVPNEKVGALIASRWDRLIAAREVFGMCRTITDAEIVQSLGCEDVVPCSLGENEGNEREGVDILYKLCTQDVQ